MARREQQLTRRGILGGALGGAAVAGLAAAQCSTTSKPNPYEPTMTTTDRQPTLYLPHGGGPCFFMDWTMGPANTWERTASWLGSIETTLPAPPNALLVVSAHWEQPVATITTRATPQLLYDYSGFPPHTYELTWPAPHAPALATRVGELLTQANIDHAADAQRGLDHGVFIPLKVAFPEAHIPTVQLSLASGLDPQRHLKLGRALAPLRDEGVFIIGSGMSYHNMRGFGQSRSLADSIAFDDWLSSALAEPASARDSALAQWSEAPSARASHPREEHLLPLMVVAGAAGDDRGARVFTDEVMAVRVSAFQFG